nr:hypothetical protein [Okeania sp. SIO2F4]
MYDFTGVRIQEAWSYTKREKRMLQMISSDRIILKIYVWNTKN